MIKYVIANWLSFLNDRNSILSFIRFLMIIQKKFIDELQVSYFKKYYQKFIYGF